MKLAMCSRGSAPCGSIGNWQRSSSHGCFRSQVFANLGIADDEFIVGKVRTPPAPCFCSKHLFTARFDQRACWQLRRNETTRATYTQTQTQRPNQSWKRQIADATFSYKLLCALAAWHEQTMSAALFVKCRMACRDDGGDPPSGLWRRSCLTACVG